jgi:membrane protease YdiL (CAAX protease family)
LWCIGFILVTQIPGAIMAIIVLVVMMAVAPETLPRDALMDQAALVKTHAFSVALAVAFLFTEVLVIGFAWLANRLVVGRDWTRQLALRRPGLAHVVLVLMGFPALVLLANVSYEIIRHVVRLPSVSDLGVPGMEQMVGLFSGWPWPFAVLVIGLGPGIGEELWCRGFLGRGLVGHHGMVLGVLFSSFFFGLIHIDPCQGTMAMLMGLFLHFVYLTTRSLWLPILLHFLNNSLSVVAGRSESLKVLDANPAAIPPYVYLAAGLLLACVGWALYQSRARLRSVEGAPDPSWHPAYPGVEYPPPGSATEVVHPKPSGKATAVAVGGFLLFVASCGIAAVAG